MTTKSKSGIRTIRMFNKVRYVPRQGNLFCRARKQHSGQRINETRWLSVRPSQQVAPQKQTNGTIDKEPVSCMIAVCRYRENRRFLSFCVRQIVMERPNGD